MQSASQFIQQVRAGSVPGWGGFPAVVPEHSAAEWSWGRGQTKKGIIVSLLAAGTVERKEPQAGEEVGDGCAGPAGWPWGPGELLGFTLSAKVALSDEGRVTCVFKYLSGGWAGWAARLEWRGSQ